MAQLTAKVAGEPSMEQMRALRASTSMRSLTSPKEVPSMLQADREANLDWAQAVANCVSGVIDNEFTKCLCDTWSSALFFADLSALGLTMCKFVEICDEQIQGPAEASCISWRRDHISSA